MALLVYRYTSNQVVSLGGGLAPSVPLDLSIESVKIVMDLLEVPKRHQLGTLQRVMSLFRLMNNDLPSNKELIEEAKEDGMEGDLVLEV